MSIPEGVSPATQESPVMEALNHISKQAEELRVRLRSVLSPTAEHDAGQNPVPEMATVLSKLSTIQETLSDTISRLVV